MLETSPEKRNRIIDGLQYMTIHGEPSTEILDLIDIGNKEYLRFFKNEILGRLIYFGGSTCRFFEGPYGAGKTHLLELLEEMALKEGMVVVRTDLTGELGLDDWCSVTRYILQNMTTIINKERKKSLVDILNVLGRLQVDGIEKLKRISLSHPGFKNAMIEALQPDHRKDESKEYLTKFLLGGKVTVAELKKVGIENVKNPLNERNSETVLRTVIEGLNLLGIPGFMLLFDENEKSLQPGRRKPSKKKILSANTIRHLIDSCITGNMPRTVVVFTILPGFLETATVHYQALGQRLAIIRDKNISGSWRWPVLAIEQVNVARSPEEFLQLAIYRFCLAIEKCGRSADGLAELMRIKGEKILSENIGSGYKRDLMKSFAELALKRIGY